MSFFVLMHVCCIWLRLNFVLDKLFVYQKAVKRKWQLWLLYWQSTIVSICHTVIFSLETFRYHMSLDISKWVYIGKAWPRWECFADFTCKFSQITYPTAEGKWIYWTAEAKVFSGLTYLHYFYSCRTSSVIVQEKDWCSQTT
jgi:hypothetical protein